MKRLRIYIKDVTGRLEFSNRQFPYAEVENLLFRGDKLLDNISGYDDNNNMFYIVIDSKHPPENYNTRVKKSGDIVIVHAIQLVRPNIFMKALMMFKKRY